MRRLTNTRIAALTAVLASGLLAAYTLRPGSAATGRSTRAQQPAVEVRTQVIRRTVHVVRHERPPRGRGTRGASAATTGAVAVASTGSVPRTSSSGSRAPSSGAAVSTPAPRTRTSGAGTGVAPSSGSSPAPVRTRTSGGSTAGPGKSTVRTRTSGGGEGGNHGGGRDD
ncbi:MAG TPA: hypothetical protein VK272_06240 [Solirubrobacteraceae bacterium]|nr:hypothetical protein [Solirubrobacteraceae bacterium]